MFHSINDVERDCFKKELLVRIMFVVCAFILNSGFIINYAVYSMRVSPHLDQHLDFIAVVMILMNVCGLFNIFLIVVNTRMNYRYRNLRIKGVPDKPFVLYLLCLPMMIFTIIGIILVMVWDVLVYGCIGSFNSVSDLIFCLVQIGNFFSVIILLLDISGQYDTGEQWSLNFINLFTVLTTLLCLWTQVIYNLILKSSTVFAVILFDTFDKNFFSRNCTSTDVVKNIVNKFNEFVIFKFETVILAMIIFTPYLVTPVSRNLRLLLQNTQVESSSSQSESIRDTPVVSMWGIIISGIFFTAYWVSFSVCHPTNCVVNQYIRIAFFAINIFMSVVMITEARFWPRSPFKGFFHFNNIILHFGAIFDFSMKTMSIIIDILSGDTLYIIENSLELGFTSVNVVMMSLVFEKYPRKPFVGSLCYYVAPMFFLIMSHVITVVKVYFINEAGIRRYTLDLRITIFGLLANGIPMFILYKVHMITILIVLYIKMYRNRNI